MASRGLDACKARRGSVAGCEGGTRPTRRGSSVVASRRAALLWRFRGRALRLRWQSCPISLSPNRWLCFFSEEERRNLLVWVLIIFVVSEEQQGGWRTFRYKGGRCQGSYQMRCRSSRRSPASSCISMRCGAASLPRFPPWQPWQSCIWTGTSSLAQSLLSWVSCQACKVDYRSRC
jgi:hypothetical protein